MSIWLGGFGGTLRGTLNVPWSSGISSPPWRLYLRLNDMADPGPSSTLLFWDEREDVINWGNFALDMAGFPDQPALTRFNGDMPASYHNRAGGLSFVDGHAEIKRWRDPRPTPPVRQGTNLTPGASPKNPDIVWLQERATRRMQ